MQGALDWLASVPTAVLYAVLAAVSAIENVFPPVPADTIVAFGSFLAARGHGTALGAFLATLVGNLAGAMGMFAVGRRYGAGPLERRMGSESSARRMQTLYGRYGMSALFVSRFIPGVRALVPPFAGALRLPALRVALVIGSASALWYALITILAFRVGSNWDALVAKLGVWSHWLIVGAVVIAAAGLIAWWIHRRRSAAP